MSPKKKSSISTKQKLPHISLRVNLDRPDYTRYNKTKKRFETRDQPICDLCVYRSKVKDVVEYGEHYFACKKSGNEPYEHTTYRQPHAKVFTTTSCSNYKPVKDLAKVVAYCASASRALMSRLKIYVDGVHAQVVSSPKRPKDSAKKKKPATRRATR